MMYWNLFQIVDLSREIYTSPQKIDKAKLFEILTDRVEYLDEKMSEFSDLVRKLVISKN